MLYRFNNIELDTTNFQLLVNSEEVSVEPQVFNLIVFLIENKNHIVSRNETRKIKIYNKNKTRS